MHLAEWILAGIYSHDTMMPNCAPLWFLTCLFVSYALFWNLIKQDSCNTRAILSMVYLFALLVICAFEKKYNITQLPWHIDVAFVASVFILIGYQLKEKMILEKINHWIIVGCFSLGTIIVLINGRINMVQNQYQNLVMFILGAMLLSIVFFYISKYLLTSKNVLIRLVSSVLEFCGQNTLMFIGFNYLFNVIVRHGFKVLGIQSQAIYCIVDCIVVITGCVVMSLLWNKTKRWWLKNDQISSNGR